MSLEFPKGALRSDLSLQERVGNFLADFYSVNGLVLESRKRREHLSEEDILRNKAIMESLSKGGNLIEQNFEVRVRQSRTPGLLLLLPLSIQACGTRERELSGLTLSVCAGGRARSFSGGGGGRGAISRYLK